ncbi:alpha/beta hydrolase [Shimia sp. FJ5]|uniref:alpha/beta hydrolase n=1 Tax=Shimia sp. FJ5 TaxID=3079054 RepID=UPI00261332B2|nr:alpha/beta hydrolase [Shimia sp. FJ5]MDV4146191.1 alpha/beta hydrolase [Shimia sp. FJ5]
MTLDDAYANAAYIPDAARFPDLWQAEADAFRKATRSEIAIAYGPGERHVMDLFLPESTPKGLVVFVHGGYWLRFDRSYWSHLAAGAVAKGWAVAMPSYDLCPSVGIPDITAQIAQAVTVAAERVDGPICLAGHSAGGHLVARMAMPGVLPEAVAGRLRHVMPISPVADLRPLMQTSMNADLGITEDIAAVESPVLGAPLPDVAVTVWVGGDERPAFLDQARWLAEAWGCGHVVTEGEHHFNVIAPLADAQSEMVACLLAEDATS